MHSEVLVQDIGKIIVFLMFILSIFLFTVKSHNKRSNQLFAIFLLVTAFDFTGLFLLDRWNNYPYLNALKIASVLVQMPLFYLYVRSACYANFKLKIEHAGHVVLFFLFLMIFMLAGVSDRSILLFEIVAEIQYYGYIIAVFLTLKRYKKVYFQNYSSSDHLQYKWLFQTTVLFVIGNLFVLIKQFYLPLQNHRFLANINLVISISALIVICWFVLKALYQPQLFTGIDKDLIPSKRLPDSASRTKDTEEHRDEINRLHQHMVHKKPYIDPTLTLQKLASEIEIPEKQLSFLINHQIGKHFFDYINDFRIKEAKVLLSDQRDLTVLEVLYDVGFNSKSSFYTAFKKHIGLTPTQFRNQLKNKE